MGTGTGTRRGCSIPSLGHALPCPQHGDARGHGLAERWGEPLMKAQRALIAQGPP